MFGFFKKNKEIVANEKEKVVVTTDYKDITKIAHYFKAQTGVDFDAQTSILKSKVITFCKKRDIYSFSELLKLVNIDKVIKQELIDYLTTNETFFYREFKQIRELVELVKNTSGNINILCAPSATGEEPYSIAIALLEENVSSSRFTIVGIDINEEALKKSKNAVYKQRNIRNLSAKIILKYFNQENDLYSVKSNIKSLVSFQLANIFDESFKNIGKFDFIFSRNMLIYFDKETKLKAKNILEKQRKNDKYEIFFGHADLF